MLFVSFIVCVFYRVYSFTENERFFLRLMTPKRFFGPIQLLMRIYVYVCVYSSLTFR